MGLWSLASMYIAAVETLGKAKHKELMISLATGLRGALAYRRKLDLPRRHWWSLS